MERSYTGSCSCQRVRYRLKTAPMFIQCCHCLMCQRQTGSAFVINGLIETERIELLGEAPVPVSMPTLSGRKHDIYRCPSCQIAVWSDYGNRPFLRFVRIATLDEPHALAPAVHIFVESKVPWVVLPEGARAFQIYYEMDKEWPAESRARWKALTGK